MIIEFTPKDFPEIILEIDFSPEEKQTWDHPGAPADYEIIKILVNNRPISLDLEDCLLDEFGYKWEIEFFEKGENYGY